MSERCDNIFCCDEDRRVIFTKNGFPIIECNNCHDRFIEITKSETHVRQVYSDDYFFEGKAGYPNYLDEKNLLIKSGKRYAKILSRFMQPGSVLDVGSAAGFILKGFEDAGWDCHGVEPNNTMASFGRNELKLDIKTSSLELFKTSEKYDLINLIQVISHLYDIDKAMQNASSLLKLNGLILVESWNMNSFYARIMGKNWHAYSPPSVVRWFSDESLIQWFNKYHFKLLDKGQPAKRISMKHALSLLEDKTPNFYYKKKLTYSLIKLVGNITLIYPFQDLTWYIFQKT